MRWLALPFALVLIGGPITAADLSAPLKTINAVGREGTGNAEAAKAWAELVKAGPDALFPILEAIADDKPTAANWLRTAIDAIAEKRASAGGEFDGDKLARFAADPKAGPAARAIAFDLLQTQAPVAAGALLMGFLNDPSLELRRKAIDKRLELAIAEPRTLRELFDAARDKDQVEGIAKSLEKLKAPADITKHFGYITRWSLSPTFDNTDGVGYAKAYAPETAAERKGWTAAQTADTYGTVDLNAALGKKMNAVAYASAAIVAENETPAELRVAGQNALKIFHNGKEVFAREEYHHGTKMDQHVAKLTLAKGTNTILLKVCQNDMPYDWAQVWGFAARLCDSTGGALPVQQIIEKDGKESRVPLGELAPKEKK